MAFGFGFILPAALLRGGALPNYITTESSDRLDAENGDNLITEN